MDERAQRPDEVDVVLHVSIGDRHYEEMSEAEIRARLHGRAIGGYVAYERVPVDPARLEAKDWHGVARGLDDLVARASELAGGLEGPVRFVVVGTAPLPVLAYLGLRMGRKRHRIVTLNPRKGSPCWDEVATEDSRRPGARDDFLVRAPQDPRRRAGTVVVSLRCSAEYSYDEAYVRSLIEDPGGELLCSYEIWRESSHTRDPLRADDMGTVIRHVETAVAVLADRCRNHHRLVLALGGPSWVAFWVAHRLASTVCGRIELPNFLRAEPGRRAEPRYAQALAWPMHQAPWVEGRLRVLFLVAEPGDAPRLDASRELEAIRAAFAGVRGRDGVEILSRGATRATKIQAILAETRPHVLHVSVHGSERRDGRLLFEDEAGDGRPLPAASFIEMLRASAGSLVAVVASACYWAPYAAELTALAPFVAATDAELHHVAVVAFAASFYGAVARGEALGPAFRRAKLDAREAYPAEAVDGLRMMHAADCPPDELFLLSAPLRG